MRGTKIDERIDCPAVTVSREGSEEQTEVDGSADLQLTRLGFRLLGEKSMRGSQERKHR